MSDRRLFLIFFFAVFSLLSPSLSQYSPPSATLIDCGSSASSVIDGRRWKSDENFVSSGTPKNVSDEVLDEILFTVRSFPLSRNGTRRKFCYVMRVSRGWKYMIRTTYYYGGVNGKGTPPPVFDQIVDGTFWGVVNTTADYADGLASYYEGVFLAQERSISVCIASNSYTTSDPFISALEVVRLDFPLYNSTEFSNFGLSLVARHAFGYSGPIIR